jgi:hypothetical protein
VGAFQIQSRNQEKFSFPYSDTMEVFNFTEGITAVIVATNQNGVPVFPFERECNVSKHHTSSANTCAVHYLLKSEGVSKILFICL